MPRKKFVKTTFSYNSFNEDNKEVDDDWGLLTCTGQMNSNIIQLKKIFENIEISNQFFLPEYGMPSQENNNKFFHLLKGIINI